MTDAVRRNEQPTAVITDHKRRFKHSTYALYNGNIRAETATLPKIC